MVICTIAAENYLPKALHLAETARRHHPDAVLVLCLVERTLHPSAAGDSPFDRQILAADLGLPGFNHFAFRHTVLELSTAIKPALLQWLLRSYPGEAVFYYLDPDIDVHGPFDEANDRLTSASILATPHHVGDVTHPTEIVDVVLPVLRYGIFNLGFLGLRRSDVAESFLAWWAHKLALFCYADPARGLFVDQKWIDLACGIFPITVLSEPGYNVANWNIGSRPIVGQPRAYTVCGRPLRFVHFSHIDIGKDQRYFRRYAPLGTEPIHRIRRAYVQRIEDIKRHIGAGDRWSFDYFESGERVNLEARLACRNQPALLARCADPFAESNEFFFMN